MNLIASLAILFLINKVRTLSFWYALILFILMYSFFKTIKKNRYKVLALAALSFIIITINPKLPMRTIAPVRTYEILSVNESTISKVGTYHVNDFHIDEVHASFDEGVKFYEYSNKVQAYEALLEGDIDRLVIDRLKKDLSYDVRSVSTIEPKSSDTAIKDISSEPSLIFLTGLDTEGESLVRSRSDMNILIALNPINETITMVSIPRDTFLPLSCKDGAMDKLTHAGLYGVECQINTLENLFGLPIDAYARTHFSGFVKVVDSMGGVDVAVGEDFQDFKEGVEHMDGTRALKFARAREEVSMGDVGRGENAQRLIKALSEKTDVLSNKIELLKIFFDEVETNVDSNDLYRLVNRKNNYIIERHMLVGKGDMQETYSQADGYKYYVLWPDEDKVLEIKAELEKTLKGE